MGSRIAVLPSDVADQIAAGEVVERPASVVKELVENSIDAGATQIDIDVRDGGRALIRVSDNGHGMEREDAIRSLERHATSKIRRAGDLVGIGTFGFRGEALPAIASVSDLTLESAASDGAATIVRVSNGVLASAAPGARRKGTTVNVEGLFAQVPARRKFLRAARSEWRAIADGLAAIALLRPEIGFRVTHDGKAMISWPPAKSFRERVAAVWGDGVVDSFVDVDDVRGPVRVHGLAEKPSDVGTASRRAWLAVNGRVVRDNGVVRAAETAYRTTVSGGMRPSLLLAVDLPGADVDVNVHPAKAEVRFRERWPLERVVEGAVRRALGTMESVSGYRTWTPAPRFNEPVDVAALRGADPGPLFENSVQPTSETASVAQADEEFALDIPTLTQVRRTWMMAERDDGVLLIDQHSAHERILYERFMKMLQGGGAPAQRLLFPLTLHLSEPEAEAFEEHRDSFTQLGFDVEGFGGQTLIINAVPMPHPRFDASRCLRESLAALAGDRHTSAHARHEKLAATIACKAAIKAGDSLSTPEMRALYAELARTTLAPHDVHGRSTIVMLSWDELERRFGR